MLYEVITLARVMLETFDPMLPVILMLPVPVPMAVIVPVLLMEPEILSVPVDIRLSVRLLDPVMVPLKVGDTDVSVSIVSVV